jgi:hypothetical protein
LFTQRETSSELFGAVCLVPSPKLRIEVKPKKSAIRILAWKFGVKYFMVNIF